MPTQCKTKCMLRHDESSMKGQEAQLKVELRANEYGYIVSRPTIQARYDLLIDDGKKIHKVQIKYTNSFQHKGNNNIVRICLSTNKNCKFYSKNEIDAVIVYVKKTGQFFWFPPEVFDQKSELAFSLLPTNHQKDKSDFYVNKYIW